MRSIAVLALVSALGGQETQPPGITGHWRTLETSRGGIGATFNFLPDGKVEYSPGAVVEQQYRIAGKDLILAPFGADTPEEKESLEFLGRDKIRITPEDGSAMELNRAGKSEDAENPIAGHWTGTREYRGRKLTTHWFFYRDGNLLFLMPFLTQTGKYSTTVDHLNVRLPGRPAVDGPYTLDGDFLTMPAPDGKGKSRLLRY